MSFSSSRYLMGVGSRVARQLLNVNKTTVLSVNSRWGLKPTLTATRSLWCLTRRPVIQVASVNSQWQSRAVHTEGDDALVQFLEDEIKREKKIEKHIPTIKGFDLTKSGTSDVEFTKSADGETIKVKFNINSSVSDMESQDENPGNEAVQMVSRPPFTVELTKGDRTLALSMMFPETGPEDLEDPSRGGEDAYEDEIIIDSIALLKKDEEWSDSVYTLQGMNMDGTMYDMLLDMLDERGITDKFLEELVNFATAYEQQHYIKFLENLKGFCSSN